ncbi:EamA domain containing protein [Parasponia andersonii]|uniref:EamA domain containing protein n=1 Tax=Parasponia andersonii TaxID=3476 RepID=A0A2P5CMF7_PARAD|nr:EamA domain containing protein [Parasponia andersonii]
MERNRCGTALSFKQSSRNSNRDNGSNMRWEMPVARKKQLFWREILFGTNSKKIRSIFLLNFITIVYASDIMVVKGAEATMDPASFSAVRFIMSAIPFLPFVFLARDDVQTRNAGIELGFWLSLAYFTEAIGLVTSETGHASFISLVTVIAVPLLDGMVGAIIPGRTWFGVLMSAIGITVLECGGSPPNVGDLLNFLSAIFFGIHMLRTEHISRSTEQENFLALIGYEACVVALLSTMWVLLGGWFDGDQNFNQTTWAWTELWDWFVTFPWIPALYTGVFSTGICSLIEVTAMRDVSATETAIIYGLEPVWGAGFAWFLLGERWGTLGWLGATLVLGGSLIVQMFGTSPKKSIEAEKGNQKGDLLLVPNEQIIKNSLSASPVMVRSRKNVIDILK